MATNPNVSTYMQGAQRYAKYTDETKCFYHSVEMKAQQPFSLVEFEITGGPHKGKKGITFEQTPYFPFEKLLPELRQEIYKLVFANPDLVYLGNFKWEKVDTDRVRRQLKWTSLLRANRAIGSEAKQVLWGSQHFIVDSMASANYFLQGRQRGGRRYITRLTVTKSGPALATNFYKLLTIARRLRCLKVTLPSRARMPLGKHIDEHYKSLVFYLAPTGANLEEAVRRLDTVCFDIGPAQRTVLDGKGEPIKAMTPELNTWCRERVRGHLEKHFAK